jgi:hypothetical protein
MSFVNLSVTGNFSMPTAALMNVSNASLTNASVGTLNGASIILTSNNTGIGNSTLLSVTTGVNTAVGAGALRFVTTGTNNTAVGSSSLDGTNGSYNTAVGAAACFNSKSGDNNVIVGYNSGSAYVEYNNNTLIGANTDIGLVGVNNATAIGYGAVADASNTIVLGGENEGVYPTVVAPGGFDGLSFSYPNGVFPAINSNSFGYLYRGVAVDPYYYNSGTGAFSGNTGNAITIPQGIWCMSVCLGGNINANYHEVVVFNTTLGTSDRQLVEGYLAWKWGLQGSLPGGHPYKSVAPT